MNTLDQELTELQHFHHLLLCQLVISLLDLLETLEKEKNKIYLFMVMNLHSFMNFVFVLVFFSLLLCRRDRNVIHFAGE